ncbi:MAG TPA: 50S ribosomal protein L25/general stress protein Ctc [Thiopseudomonas sp.]|nr:50S ribosomal protein L25/general stress protein Ctc [Thiopseudomonas sp.]
MSEFTLNVQSRTDLGKGASRRLRRNANLIPAVVYGGDEEPELISLETREMARLLLNDAAFSSILELNNAGTKQSVLIKDLQRHPSRELVLHADFVRIIAGQKLTTMIPVVLINEEECVGVKLGGGDIFRLATELEVTCLPQDLPESIVIDMLEVDLNETVHLADVKAPEGVEFTELDLEQDINPAIATVSPARLEEEEDEEQDQPLDEAEEQEDKEDSGEEEN